MNCRTEPTSGAVGRQNHQERSGARIPSTIASSPSLPSLHARAIPRRYSHSSPYGAAFSEKGVMLAHKIPVGPCHARRAISPLMRFFGWARSEFCNVMRYLDHRYIVCYRAAYQFFHGFENNSNFLMFLLTSTEFRPK